MGDKIESRRRLPLSMTIVKTILSDNQHYMISLETILILYTVENFIYIFFG